MNSNDYRLIGLWSEIRNEIPANEAKHSRIAHTMTAEVEKKFEVMHVEGIVYDIKDLYQIGSTVEIKNTILNQLLGEDWINYETQRVSTMLGLFYVEWQPEVDRDEEEFKVQPKSDLLYPDPERTLSNRLPRQRMTNSEKLYIFKKVTNEPDCLSDILCKLNLSYGWVRGIIKKYSDIPTPFKWKQVSTRQRLLDSRVIWNLLQQYIQQHSYWKTVSDASAYVYK